VTRAALSQAQRSAAASTPAPAEAAAPEAAPAETARTILLVDDEPDVRQVLGRHFGAAGFEIVEAGDPEQAAKLAARLRSETKRFVLVTDLGMPASGGASFQGGFEVVKRLWKMNLRPPVLMMTESLNQALRLRARQMGVQSFVFKPTLSKLNPRQFEADLSAFADKLVRDVLPHLAELAVLRAQSLPARKGAAAVEATGGPRPEAGPPAEGAARPFEFLKRRLIELREGGDANEIAMLVMKVAREFFERALLFVVKNEEARGLGGFGLAPREETLNLLARQIAIPLGEVSLFRDVARERRAFSGTPPSDRWLGHMLGRIGRFQSRGIALLPLVAHRETIAMVFGDNPETGREPGSLEPLEVFVQQAGIALENVFLQKKLQAAEEKDRASLR
jgi:CheY-like chemotaxis protein